MANFSLPESYNPNNSCSVNDCAGKVKARGLCGKHYHRWERHGDPERTLRRSHCLVESCRSKHYAKSFCERHYTRFKKYGDPHTVHHLKGDGDSAEEQFWSRVNKMGNSQGCWEWQGARSDNGYGATSLNGKQVGSHVAAWFFKNGRMPDGLLRHLCDNRLCVNNAHLLEGSHQDNMRDMTQRNRQARGEKVATSKLVESDVRAIKELFGQLNDHEIAKIFGVSATAIRYIRIGRNWKHIP